MKRTLYQYLVRLHPPTFRRQFAEEMLWVFEEAEASAGAFSLYSDGLVSLIRQWTLHAGAWKLPVALVGACLQITAGGLVWLIPWHSHALTGFKVDRCRGGETEYASVADVVAMGHLIPLILVLVGALVLMVVAASLWAKGFLAQRTRTSARVGFEIQKGRASQ